MELIIDSGITLGIFPVLELLAPELKVYFTTREGGTSPPPYDSLNLGDGLGDRPGNVRRNRRLLLATLGIDSRRIVRAVQVHGSKIAVVNRGGIYRGVDGLITATRNLTLAVNTADCFAIFIYSPPEKTLAALHVGLGGARTGIIRHALGILDKRFRIDTEHALALIGPGICRKCYTFPEPSYPPVPDQYRKERDGRWHVDLHSLIVHQLEKAGLRESHILDSGMCTSCEPKLFFSHRRDLGKTGRHWALATVSKSP